MIPSARLGQSTGWATFVRVPGEGIRPSVAMVRCAECGKLGEGSMEGWRAMLGTDIDDENAPTEAYAFCPDYAEREFGPPRGAARTP
jgi:hypothetical protein